jgi:excisionase family DNA binding protein
MSKYVTIKEYAQQQGVTERTVYRWVTNNEIEVKKIKGILHVKVDEESSDEVELILTLKSENSHLLKQVEYLQTQLAHAQETIDTMQQRSDTIIMKLTMQFEQQTQLLEDMRHQQNLHWVKRLFRR